MNSWKAIAALHPVVLLRLGSDIFFPYRHTFCAAWPCKRSVGLPIARRKLEKTWEIALLDCCAHPDLFM
jgi:hypothetical protein